MSHKEKVPFKYRQTITLPDEKAVKAARKALCPSDDAGVDECDFFELLPMADILFACPVGKEPDHGLYFDMDDRYAAIRVHLEKLSGEKGSLTVAKTAMLLVPYFHDEHFRIRVAERIMLADSDDVDDSTMWNVCGRTVSCAEAGGSFLRELTWGPSLDPTTRMDADHGVKSLAADVVWEGLTLTFTTYYAPVPAVASELARLHVKRTVGYSYVRRNSSERFECTFDGRGRMTRAHVELDEEQRTEGDEADASISDESALGSKGAGPGAPECGDSK